jgi:hypothetical protein
MPLSVPSVKSVVLKNASESSTDSPQELLFMPGRRLTRSVAGAPADWLL